MFKDMNYPTNKPVDSVSANSNSPDLSSAAKVSDYISGAAQKANGVSDLNGAAPQKADSIASSLGSATEKAVAGLKNHDQNSINDIFQKNPDKLKVPEKSIGDEIKKITESVDNTSIKDSLRELMMDKHSYYKGIGKGGDGDHILPTGDRIERKDGRETLTTPDGSTLTVNPDGTFKTTGNVSKISENQNGSHTVTYGDGSTVTFGKNGVEKVERGNTRAEFKSLDGLIRNKPDWHKELKPVLNPKPWDDREPKPWIERDSKPWLNETRK